MAGLGLNPIFGGKMTRGDVPVFGLSHPGAFYVRRRGGYVVITDPQSQVAVVRIAQRAYLPGGGAKPRESHRLAAV